MEMVKVKLQAFDLGLDALIYNSRTKAVVKIATQDMLDKQRQLSRLTLKLFGKFRIERCAFSIDPQEEYEGTATLTTGAMDPQEYMRLQIYIEKRLGKLKSYIKDIDFKKGHNNSAVIVVTFALNDRG
jgi:hypothetical protein